MLVEELQPPALPIPFEAHDTSNMGDETGGEIDCNCEECHENEFWDNETDTNSDANVKMEPYYILNLFHVSK